MKHSVWGRFNGFTLRCHYDITATIQPYNLAASNRLKTRQNQPNQYGCRLRHWQVQRPSVNAVERSSYKATCIVFRVSTYLGHFSRYMDVGRGNVEPLWTAQCYLFVDLFTELFGRRTRGFISVQLSKKFDYCPSWTVANHNLGTSWAETSLHLHLLKSSTISHIHLELFDKPADTFAHLPLLFLNMGHSRPLFLYFRLFNTQLTVNKCSI